MPSELTDLPAGPGLVRGLIQSRYLDRLVGSRRGRAFLLAFMADAERSDEAAVFDTLLARVDDPELHDMVKLHVADEERHGEILEVCMKRVGVTPLPVPDHLRFIFRLDAALDGFAARFVAGEYGVMEAYLLLQVIEERAVVQYPGIQRALAKVDPEAARVVGTVIADERRHVRYARAISKRYAPNPDALARTLAHFRRAEARAFAEHGQDFLNFAIDRDLLDVRWPERLLWRAIGAAPAHA